MTPTIRIYNDDALNRLKTFDSDSVDALVTDPPAGISFMGKEWDHHKGGRKEWITWMSEVMRESLRVMKPGAHGLVWAIPRTSHWTASALEDAGFEIRDVVTHLFGQGFPKSLDVSKAIDKAAGAEREIVEIRTKNGDMRGSKNFGNHNQSGKKVECNIAAPSTDSAKQWQGWGTALKPASEHWILIRKPCSEKTVAANVLKWGTGAINIDGSRIETDELKNKTYNNSGKDLTWGGTYGMGTVQGNPIGRFPANLVLSHSENCTDDQCDADCAVVALDAQSGQLSQCGGPKKTNHDRGMFGIGQPGAIYREENRGASRFFYCAKISSSERNAGLEDMPDKEGGIKNSSGRGYSESDPHKKIIVKNNHPTVKPQKLMRYLIKMITPPSGIVLDPFMGSGSTGLAAKSEGFQFIGIEKERDYFLISEKRIGIEYPDFGI